jgi:hypothetical protein
MYHENWVKPGTNLPKDDAGHHFDISHSVDAIYEPKPKQGSGCRNFWVLQTSTPGLLPPSKTGRHFQAVFNSSYPKQSGNPGFEVIIKHLSNCRWRHWTRSAGSGLDRSISQGGSTLSPSAMIPLLADPVTKDVFLRTLFPFIPLSCILDADYAAPLQLQV